MKGKFNKAFAVLMSVILLASVAVIGCAAPAPTPSPEPTAPAPPKEKVTLRVCEFGDASGPYRVTIAPVMDGCLDFAKWANENDYIPGVRLDIRTYDHGLDMARCVSAFREAMTGTPKPVLSNAGLWSDAAPVLKALASRYKVPLIDSTAVRTAVFPIGWYFAQQSSYESQVGAFGDWIVENWKQDSDVAWIANHWEDRPPRLALVSWDIALGRANESPEAIAYVKSKGIEYVGAEYIGVAAADTTPQLSRLKGKVDFIFIGMFPSAWSTVLKDAERLGMRDQFIACGPAYFYPSHVIEFVGPELAENTMSLKITKENFDDLAPYIQEAHLARDYPKTFMTYAAGWYTGDLFAEVIRKTIERVGVENVTGMTCYEALCDGAITNFKPMVSYTTITWANNPRMVKIGGADSARMGLVMKNKEFRYWDDRYLPRLLPGEPDIPLEFLEK